jgi:predicted AlkP superfamily pyrophosphatase or phosphodiesterase
MTRIMPLLLGLCLLSWPLEAWSAPTLVVSIDGLPWWLLEREVARLPTLGQLWRQGSRGPLQSVFPSMTWPAHTSMVTGVQPGEHGVLGNRVLDRATGQIVECWNVPKSEIVRTPTVYDAAAQAGRSVAAVLWPATSGAAALRWNLPEVHSAQALRDGASPGLLDELGKVGLSAALLARFSNEEQFLLDSYVRDAAVYLIERKRPDLMLLHFVAVDTMEHVYGPESRPTLWALHLVDRYLADVLAAYERGQQQPNVLLVSDHGFLTMKRYVDPEQVLRQLLGRNARKLKTVTNGHALFVYGLAEAEREGVLAAARKLPELAQAWGPVELTAVGFVPEHPHTPDLVLVAPDDALWGRKPAAGGVRLPGMHGFPPEHPKLQGVFVAAGPDVVGGLLLANLRVVDVAPLVAKLQDVPWPRQPGQPQHGQLRTEVLREAGPPRQTP